MERVLGRIKLIKVNGHYKITAYILGFMLCTFFIAWNWEESVYWDCAGYSKMAQEFLEKGLFNFQAHFEENSFVMRGYAWPWMIALFQKIGLQTRMGWIFIYSLFVSFGFTFLIPEIFELLFSRQLKIIPRILPLVFTCYVWPGLLVYTLSDIPAVIMGALGLYILLLIEKKRYAFWTNVLLGAVCGLVMGFSYYIRSGNMASVILILAALFVYCYKKEGMKKIAVAVAFVIGVMISMVPQIQININCNHVFSYKVPIFLTSNIEGEEYVRGASWIRYETVLPGGYPEEAAIAESDLTKTWLEVDNIPRESVNLSKLLKHMARHPFEYLGIYSAKFANYMEARFGEIYIRDFKYISYGKVIFNFVIWFIAFAGLLLLLKKETDKKLVLGSLELTNFIYFIKEYLIFVFIFIVPSLVHIAGTHVESRYVFGLQLFLWQFVCGILPWKLFLLNLKKYMVTYLVLFISLLGCCCSIWNFTLEKIPYYQYTLQNKPGMSSLSKEEFISQYEDNTGGAFETNIGVLNYEEKKLDFDGYAFEYERNCKDLKYSICFVKDGSQFYYDLDTYERSDVALEYGEMYSDSGLHFSAYLFDLSEGVYDMGLFINDGEKDYFIDLLYDVEISGEE